ncbi:MAG: hypothetical protein Q4B60_05490 [Erysipelotrichaceae bacterium]|nr:hypothetical protein [Erysipelotrichaceae bacterium]
MANTTTIKQKFLDILFEPENEEEERKLKETEKKKSENSLSAKDLLYKTNKETDLVSPKPAPQPVKQAPVTPKPSPTFINYNKEKEIEIPKIVEETKEEIYVSRPNLSPIFGDMDASNPKKKKNENKTVNATFAATDKPSSSYLGIVLSPIYGYDTLKANEERVKVNKVEEEKLDMTEDLGDIFATEEFKQEAFDDETEVVPAEIDLFADFYAKK